MHDHLDGQLKKAEEALKKERGQMESELAACAAEMETLDRDIEAARDGLSATAESAKELDASIIVKLAEECVHDTLLVPLRCLLSVACSC